jgi:hypothetical protein
MLLLLIVLFQSCKITFSFIPLLDGGKTMPVLYDGWFNEQIAKQASTAVSKAISAGKVSSYPTRNSNFWFQKNVSPMLSLSLSLFVTDCLTIKKRKKWK